MTNLKCIQIKKELNKMLDFWCEQYKYANNVSHDLAEQERISKNIVALERTLKLL